MLNPAEGRLRGAQPFLSLISSGVSSSSSHPPAPHADLSKAAFIDCKEIVIHSLACCSQGWYLSPSRCRHRPPPTPGGKSPERLVPQGCHLAGGGGGAPAVCLLFML